MQLYYTFPDIETAISELDKIGYLSKGVFNNEIYHIVPKERTSDYPFICKTPRFIAVLLNSGELTFDNPFDNNLVIVNYQSHLKSEFDFTLKPPSKTLLLNQIEIM